MCLVIDAGHWLGASVSPRGLLHVVSPQGLVWASSQQSGWVLKARIWETEAQLYLCYALDSETKQHFFWFMVGTVTSLHSNLRKAIQPQLLEGGKECMYIGANTTGNYNLLRLYQKQNPLKFLMHLSRELEPNVMITKDRAEINCLVWHKTCRSDNLISNIQLSRNK